MLHVLDISPKIRVCLVVVHATGQLMPQGRPQSVRNHDLPQVVFIQLHGWLV